MSDYLTTVYELGIGNLILTVVTVLLETAVCTHMCGIVVGRSSLSM